MEQNHFVIGETIIVPSPDTWDPEVLTIVALQDDMEAARLLGAQRVIHIFCQSPNWEDNVHTLPNGVKYYTITTEVVSE